MANRIESVMRRIGSNPTQNMALLLEVIDTVEIVPKPDQYYVFVYKAKTRGLKYDQHPFIVCTSIHPWGFIGYNFHWQMYRRYTWAEVVTNLFQLEEEEIPIVNNIPLAKFSIVP
jgi:hypothetical protein